MKRFGLTFALLAAAFTCGCANQNAAKSVRTEDCAFTAVSRLYDSAFSDNHNRQVRKPRVDARRRAMHEMAAVASTQLAQAVDSTSETRLASATESAHSENVTVTNAYRQALESLQSAAERGDEFAVRREYARLRAAHQHLLVRAENVE